MLRAYCFVCIPPYYKDSTVLIIVCMYVCPSDREEWLCPTIRRLNNQSINQSMPEKSFSSIALALPGGVTKYFQNFYRLSWITLSILLKSNQILMQKWALYNITDGANLVKFKVGEGFLNGLNECCKEGNLDDFCNRVSWEPLGWFLSDLIHRVTRL